MRAAAATALVLSGLVLAGCGGHAAARPSDRKIEELVLRQKDLAGGFESFSNGPQGRVEASPVLAGDPSRFGRQRGWVARYRYVGELKRARAATIVSTVDVFARSSGASKFFHAIEKRDGETAPSTGLTEVDAPRLGDETHAITTAHAPAGSVKYVMVAWRDGRFVGAVSASGFAPRLQLSDVVALARRQQARIAKTE